MELGAGGKGHRLNKAFDILLVEDNADLAGNVIDYLEALGHRLHYAADGEAGVREALMRPVDVVLLDLALPRRDGLSVCAEIRRRADHRIPILMLTARDTLDDKLAGFASGADDYLVKPFSLAELAARITALAQRPQLGPSPDRHRAADHRPAAAHGDARRAAAPSVAAALGHSAVACRSVAASRSHAPRSRRKLWGDQPPSSDALRSHIHLLRQIVDKPFDAPMIETVHSIGFRLSASQ